MGLFSFGKSSTLYFPGCLTYFKYKEYFDLYKKIFLKLGIDFRVLDRNLCSGIELLEAGYDTEVRRLARQNNDIFKEENIKEIITNSPECFKVFLKDYPEIMPDWSIEVKNIWKIILDRLKDKPRLIKFKAMEVIGFHDSCYLGRYCEIYDEPRKILEIIGYEVKEMENSREESMCCGSCGGLARTNPELADGIAKERILQAKRAGIKKLVVCSLDNYRLLKKNSKDVEILEFSEVLALALGIRKIEKDEEEIISEHEVNKIFEESDLSKSEEIIENG